MCGMRSLHHKLVLFAIRIIIVSCSSVINGRLLCVEQLQLGSNIIHICMVETWRKLPIGIVLLLVHSSVQFQN